MTTCPTHPETQLQCPRCIGQRGGGARADARQSARRPRKRPTVARATALGQRHGRADRLQPPPGLPRNPDPALLGAVAAAAVGLRHGTPTWEAYTLAYARAYLAASS